MRISIDERHAGLPGIGRFSTELAAALRRRASADEIVSLRRPRPTGWLGAAAFSGGPGSMLSIASPPVGPLEQVELALRLRQHRIQLHHSTHLSLPWLAGVPVVLTVHDLFPLTEPGHARSDWAAGYYRVALPWAVKRADAVVAVSDYTAAQIKEVLGRTVDAVIGHGVDHSAWRLPASRAPLAATEPPASDGDTGASPPAGGHRSQRPYLLYVGTAKRHKNLGTLLAAHAGARDSRGERLPELVLAGPTEAELTAAGDRPGEGVRVLGRVPDRDLPALYAGAGAVAVPSLYEGFGLAALEAMALGVPVVAADSPGLADTVGDAAVLVAPRDPAAWADALARATGDPALRRTLVERGRTHSARFRWDDAADSYLALYRKVLER